MLEPGQIVTIKPEWRDNPVAKPIGYVVLEDNGDRVKIQALGTGFAFAPIELARPEWLDRQVS